MPKHAFAGAAALMLATAPSAWADLSAPDVWADWQEIYGSFGMALTADETYSGGTLTLDNMTMTFDFGEDLSSSSNYGTLRMIEQGDGSLRIELPEEMTTTTRTEGAGEVIEQTFIMRHEGLDFTVSEDGDVRTYVMNAASFSYEFEDIAGPNAPDPIALVMEMTNLATTYTSSPDGEGVAINQDFSAEALTVSASDLEAEEPFDVSYVATALTGTGGGTMLPGLLPEDGGAFNLEGINFDFTFGHGGSETAITADTLDGPFQFDASSTGGEIFVGVDGDGLTETFSSQGAQMALQVPQFPVPINASMAETVLGFTLPMGVSEDTKPFGLDVVLRDLVIDETLWALFDPTGQLPRDPATLVVDLVGGARMLVDLIGDPDGLATLQGPPGELKSLTLNALELDLAGASLRGTGDLDFPVSTPVPEPVGTIELSLDGGFALVDKLVALGFVPAEQAAFVKGMSGAVAEQVGEDQLQSTIEFTEGGGITANGLPLQ